MKKYMLVIVIGSLLGTSYIGAAEKKPISTVLSNDEVAQLREAISNYKNNTSREEAEHIINWYHKTYPGDKFVTSKMNEKARFDLGSQANLNLGQSSMQSSMMQSSSMQSSTVQQSPVQQEEEKTCCVCMDKK